MRELEAQKPGASKNYRCFTVSKTDLLARFRYSGKITPKERTHDSEVDNNHPTVKTVALMQWLISLITPPKGVVLDTFNGSGSTGVSCLSLSDLQPSYIGMERDPLYVKVTRKRFRHTVRHLRKSSHGMKTLF